MRRFKLKEDFEMKESALHHFPWYDYASGEPVLDDETLKSAMEDTGSTDMNTTLWNKAHNPDYGDFYMTMIKNQHEMVFMNYCPNRRFTWLQDISSDDNLLEFHTESWEEVERLRYQLNFND